MIKALTARSVLAVAAFGLLLTGPAYQAAAKDPSRLTKLIASADGKTKQTAYRVKSVAEEHEVLGALGLRPLSQSLIIGGDNKPFDLIEAVNPATGEMREIWFYIGSFYGREF